MFDDDVAVESGGEFEEYFVEELLVVWRGWGELCEGGEDVGLDGDFVGEVGGAYGGVHGLALPVASVVVEGEWEVACGAECGHGDGGPLEVGVEDVFGLVVVEGEE